MGASDWSCEQTAAFVKGISENKLWETYADIVRKEDIDGSMLADATKEDLQELGFKGLHASKVIKIFGSQSMSGEKKDAVSTDVRDMTRRESAKNAFRKKLTKNKGHTANMSPITSYFSSQNAGSKREQNVRKDVNVHPSELRTLGEILRLDDELVIPGTGRQETQAGARHVQEVERWSG
jgi:hypothetical protein